MANIINTIISIDGKEISRFSAFKLEQSIYEHHHFQLICPAEAIDGTEGVMFNTSKNLIGKTLSVQVDTIDGISGLRFAGVVTKISRTRYSGHSGDVLITGYSPSILLDSGPHCKSWSKQALKNIAQDVLKHFPQNVLNPQVQPRSNETFSYTVQYKETAWQFLKRLCAENGEWLYYEGESLHIGKPSGNTLSLVFGSDLEDFQLGIQVRPATMQSMSYDYTNTVVYNSQPQGIEQKAGLDEMGKHAYTASKTLYSTVPKSWNHQFHSNQKQLDNQVNTRSALESSNMVKFEGHGSHPGVAIGTQVSVSGTNIYSQAAEDYGSYTITAVTHTILDNNSYSNTFEAVPASVQVPPIEIPAIIRCETQSALVTDNHDPQGLGRIKVKFHWMNGAEKTPWIRVTSPHGGGGKGMFFIPEVNEEVIIGFEGDSATKPYVIGTVYNSKANSSFGNSANDVKAMQSRSGNKLVMNDAAGSVQLADKGGADMLFDGAGNANLSVTDTVSMKADNEINTEATNQITIKCGEASITLIKDGTIIINGHEIYTDGKTHVCVTSGESSGMIVKPDSIEHGSCNITHSATSEMSMGGPKVGIGGGSEVNVSSGKISMN